jgi:hypothetical protein
VSDDLKSPFLFVPAGSPAPDAVRGPNWIRIPATFVPREGGRTTASGEPWPRDRKGREWAKDRFWRPIVPLDQMPPGEAAPEFDDPVAVFLKMNEVFRDPAGTAGLRQLAAGTDGQSHPSTVGVNRDNSSAVSVPIGFRYLSLQG